MSSSLKNEISASDFEVDAPDLRLMCKARIIAMVHNLRVAMTALALAAGISILGLSGNSLAVYKNTYVPDDYLLPLWPESFDIRPTTALVVGSAIATVVNVMSLCTSEIPSLRARAGAHASASLAAPVVGFIAALVAMAFFYAINASTTIDTFQSWTCRWKQVNMTAQPHFGTLCRQSKVGLILAVLLVPLELFVLATACFQVFLERKVGAVSHKRGGRGGSPAMS
ncbi:hypothetical protein TOPH_02495 [Tolypocladium ophioglossoides CBS 100239]|uniref:Uncharacterized protein n=1 Tax=Tolypocladium ophioglossoides (strain CBS 100239) TaxID=1163406 RepID=A0A0L0NF50_TOLOC|nr:hypothetical protein TOPH_02495 [Tolypocladium ophioglossoides CBS 100239]